MENFKNNNQSIPVDPAVNVAPPAGLNERVIQQNSKIKSSKKRVIFFITAIVSFVIIGVGAWWYYAQGQASILLEQANWGWGQENLENYQQDTSFSLEINTKNSEQPDMYTMFFNSQKININIANKQKNIGQNLESDTHFVVEAGNSNLDITLETKKIDNIFYFLIDLGNLKDMLGAFIQIPDINNTWLEIDMEDAYKNMEDSYSLSINKDNLAKINVQFNNFLGALKDEKVFNITDLKKDPNGFRKIKLNIKEDKIDDFVILTIDYIADIYETILDVDKNSPIYEDYRTDYRESFDEMTRNPEEWASFKKMFAAVDFVILVNPKTKNIHGLELYINDMIIDNRGSVVILNGDLKYFINAIDYYDISTPNNTTKLEEALGNLMDSSNLGGIEGDLFNDIDTDQDGLSDSMEGFYGTDINNPDSDGDGYLDGAEVDNGYNPMGEGELNVNDSVSNSEISDLEVLSNAYEILKEVKALQVPTVTYSFKVQQTTNEDDMTTNTYVANFIPGKGIKVDKNDLNAILTVDVEEFLNEMISYSPVSVMIADESGQTQLVLEGGDVSGTKELKILIDQDKKYVTHIYISILDQQFAEISFKYSVKQNGYWLPNEIVIHHFTDDSRTTLELSEYNFE